MIETLPQPRHRLYWLLAALCLLAGVTMLVATGWHPAPSAAQPTATVNAHAPVAVAAGPWQRLALPVPAQDVQSLAVAPDDASTLYACAAPAPVTLWRTTDAGAHWTRYAPPLASGTICAISIAPDNPARIGVQVMAVEDQSHPCASTALYLSDDRGATWRTLPPPPSAAPASATSVWCGLEVTARHLFMLTSFDSGLSAPQTTVLERSDDGAHWTRADLGLPSGLLFSSLIVGRDDHMIMVADRWGSAQAMAEHDLLVSDDGGQTWRVLSHPPDPIGTFLLSAGLSAGGQWPTASHPFYALSSDQIPADLYRVGIYSSGDGQHWGLVPALPVPGVSDVQHGVLQVLAALPDGRLAAWGADPHAGLLSEEAAKEPLTTFWLWLWDPTLHQWQVVPTPLTATQQGCSGCWYGQTAADHGGATYLYVFGWPFPTLDAPPGLFRIRLAPRL